MGGVRNADIPLSCLRDRTSTRRVRRVSKSRPTLQSLRRFARDLANRSSGLFEVWHNRARPPRQPGNLGIRQTRRRKAVSQLRADPPAGLGSSLKNSGRQERLLRLIPFFAQKQMGQTFLSGELRQFFNGPGRLGQKGVLAMSNRRVMNRRLATGSGGPDRVQPAVGPSNWTGRICPAGLDRLRRP